MSTTGGLDISEEMKQHIAQSPTTLCVNWKVTRRDGVVFGFTSHVRDLIYDGVLYKASSGMTPSGFQNSADLSVDNMEIQAVFDDDAITERDMLAGVYDNSRIEVFLLNYNDLSMGKIQGPVGSTGKLSRREGVFIAENRTFDQRLNQNLLPRVSERCRVKKLGDEFCKVNLAGKTKDGYDITTQGWVSSAADRHDFTSNLSTSSPPPYARAELYFWETVTFTSGKNSGKTFSLLSFNGSKGMIFIDEQNPTKRISNGDQGVIHAKLKTDSSPVEFNFKVADYVRNSEEVSFFVEGAFWTYDGLPPTTDTFPYGHFSSGLVTFTTGENHGVAREVKEYKDGGQFVLAEPFPFEIKTGDHFEAVAGCDRRSETCIGKYDNIINFRGEFTVPGIEKAHEIRDAKKTTRGERREAGMR